MANNTKWYVTATVTYWDRTEGDYTEVELDHYSNESTPEAAEDDAREAWGDHGHSPELVTVKTYA